jgi:hypothetical protein
MSERRKPNRQSGTHSNAGSSPALSATPDVVPAEIAAARPDRHRVPPFRRHPVRGRRRPCRSGSSFHTTGADRCRCGTERVGESELAFVEPQHRSVTRRSDREVPKGNRIRRSPQRSGPGFRSKGADSKRCPRSIAELPCRVGWNRFRADWRRRRTEISDCQKRSSGQRSNGLLSSETASVWIGPRFRVARCWRRPTTGLRAGSIPENTSPTHFNAACVSRVLLLPSRAGSAPNSVLRSLRCSVF